MQEFIEYNGIKIVEASEDKSVVTVNMTEHSLNPFKIAHGGLIFALGDTVMGVTCYTTHKEFVTLNSTIDFLKPGIGKVLTATSEVIKKGRTTWVLRANITNDNDEVIAIMTATYYIKD